MNGKPMNVVGRSAIAGFFVIHYGIFWFVHGIFVLTLPLFAGIGSASGLVSNHGPVAEDPLSTVPSSGRCPHRART